MKERKKQQGKNIRGRELIVSKYKNKTNMTNDKYTRVYTQLAEPQPPY